MDCSSCGSPLGADLACIACRPSQAVDEGPGEDRSEHRTPGTERRDARRQRPVAGGTRATDPPLTTRACADWMGMTTEWIRVAIDEGHQVAGGRRVRLPAEMLEINGRRLYRIHLDDFIAFLKAYGWRRIPQHPREHAGVPS